jgi:general stress protein 26
MLTPPRPPPATIKGCSSLIGTLIMKEPKTDHDRLWSLIKDLRFAMLTHRHGDGSLHAHPLTLQDKSIDELGVLHFFVGRTTEVGERIRVDGNVNISFVDPNKDIYVSIAGQATISEDKDTKKRLFNALDRGWFPGGVDDPNLELVEVRIKHAEYWDVKESKLTQLLKIATAAATHTQAHVGTHGELRIGEHVAPAKPAAYVEGADHVTHR